MPAYQPTTITVATYTTAVAAWHAYTIDYNTHKLVEYANIDTNAHTAIAV